MQDESEVHQVVVIPIIGKTLGKSLRQSPVFAGSDHDGDVMIHTDSASHQLDIDRISEYRTVPFIPIEILVSRQRIDFIIPVAAPGGLYIVNMDRIVRTGIG